MTGGEAQRRIVEAYARRREVTGYDAYVQAYWSELARHYERHIDSIPDRDRTDVKLLEVGCGTGGKLLRLIDLGLSPGNLTGVELLEEAAASARSRLPEACTIIQGDACNIEADDGSFDIVFASTVFSSILDDAMQQSLAEEMWRLVRPGGAALWYDFVYDNPRNPDVRGVPKARIAELFPHAEPRRFHRVTLAPPIGRRINWAGVAGYRLFNAAPFLRSHVVGWMPKARAAI